MVKKEKTLLFSLIVIILISLGSCRNKEEDDFLLWDVNPVCLHIYFHNLNGKNLLDESTEGNLLDSEMYIIYKDEKYPVVKGWPDMDTRYKTRYYLPQWKGAFIAPSWKEGQIELGEAIFIGEIEGTENGEVTLFIGGKKYEFSFTNKIIKPSEIERKFYLDGNLNYNDTFYIRVFSEN